MMKELLGVLIKDVPRYLAALRGNSQSYLELCNRTEQLEPAPDGSGFRCNWQWTSDLHAPKVLPLLGKWVMRRALRAHPIRCGKEPASLSLQPDVSFIIGHRGVARLPHLLATLESIAGQCDVACECIVVEQDAYSHLPDDLPSWVRIIHSPPPDSEMPYCRSWAFNVGSRYARGRLLVLHDNDMVIPSDYASLHLARVSQGFEVVNLKRYIFFLSQFDTEQWFQGRRQVDRLSPDGIMQNAEGGGSIAITREAFERIGGMDESFVGWGGEDNEFWERAQACRVWPYGCLPLVHLWHPAQPGKYQADNPTLVHWRTLANIPVEDRIARLVAQPRGELSGPFQDSGDRGES